MNIEPEYSIKVEKLSENLCSLYGKDVQVLDVTGKKTQDKNCFIGIFKRKNKTVWTVVSCDYKFACMAALSLMLINQNEYEELLKSQVVNDNIVDNLKEVFNVMSNAFSNERNINLDFDHIFMPGNDLSGPAISILSWPKSYSMFSLEVSGVPGGFLEFSIC